MNRHQGRNIIKLEGSYIKALKKRALDKNSQTSAVVSRSLGYLVQALWQSGLSTDEASKRVAEIRNSINQEEK
jgi:hypothetical protein